MKQCPRCHQTYSDDQLNFCLEDGELLSNYASDQPSRFADDAPPTMILNEARVTNPVNWPAQPMSQPISQWQQPQQNLQNQPFGSPTFIQKRDQVLPTVSLIAGIASVALICCMGGIWLGLPAAVIGFLGMRNADSDPSRYGGRGMAIAGMVLGAISFLGSVIVALLSR